MAKVAIVQKSSVFLDKEKSIRCAVESVAEAAAGEAELVIFTEAFIPGYPAWIWRLRPGADWNLAEELHSRLCLSAVTMESEDLAPLYAAARKHRVAIVCGLEERDSGLSRSTLFNTAIVIGPDGTLLNKHRKIMPTNPERMVWGTGDGTGLKVVDTPVGRIGVLICWENYMPLARYALYAQGVEIYIAPTYDSGDKWLGSLQHIAREGRCWVIGCGNLLQAGALPDDLPGKAGMYPDNDEWVNPGDSIVISPTGDVVAGPMRMQSGLLFCDIDLRSVGVARRVLDVAGHYARPDIFTLQVNTRPQSPIQFNKQGHNSKPVTAGSGGST